MIYKIIHLRTGIKVFVGTLEECYAKCLELKDGEFVVIAQ